MTPKAQIKRSLVFFLVNDFTMVAFATALEPLRIANRMLGYEAYQWRLTSADGKPVSASNGVLCAVNTSLDDERRKMSGQDRPSMVVVCSGVNVEDYGSKTIYAWLREEYNRGVAIGGLCTGAYILAAAGLLSNKRCAIHWENLPGFAEAFPKANVFADLFEVDQNIYTCAGGTAALDMMLHLISVQHGHRLATAVSEQFIHAQIRDPQNHQRMEPRVRQGISHAGLARAIGLMEANLEDPLDAERLADAAGLSLRQLERLFHKHFSMTPRRYYLDLRLQRARSLLQYTDLPVVEIAVACGFGSAAHFSRSYHAWTGKAPSGERRRVEAGIMPALR